MNASDIAREAGHLRGRVSECDRRLRESEALLRTLTAVEPWRYRQTDVDEVKRVMRRDTSERADFAERIAALEAGLPTDDAKRLGRSEVAALRARAAIADALFSATCADLMPALDAVEAAVRTLARSAAERRTAHLGAQDVAARLALDDLPAAIASANCAAEMRVIAAVGSLLRHVGSYADVDVTIDAEVQAARRGAGRTLVP